jgi:hypothetical protein
VCLVGFALSSLAQSSTIATYAGSRHSPVNGAQAITQPSIGPHRQFQTPSAGFTSPAVSTEFTGSLRMVR